MASTMTDNAAIATENTKVSKKKLSDTPKKRTDRSTKSVKYGKGRKTDRHQRSEKWERSRRRKEEVSSDSDEYSTSDSDDGHSVISSESPSSLSSEEEHDRRRSRRRRSRRSPSISHRASHRSRAGSRGDRLQPMSGNQSEVEAQNDTVLARQGETYNSQNWPGWGDDPGAQRNMEDAIAQLEYRFSQLQFHVERLDGMSARGANKIPGSEQLAEQPPMPLPATLRNPYPLPVINPSSNRIWNSEPPGSMRRMMSQRGPPPPRSGSPRPPRQSRITISDNTTRFKSKSKRPKKLDYKRVDSVWDSSRYAFKLQDTAETAVSSKYDQYLFHVRRTFDSEGKYRSTVVDIKSKLLRECLQDVIGNTRGVSLVDETPKLDPNLLFLYLEDFRSHLKNLKDLEPAGRDTRERRKGQIRLDNKRKQLKVLVRYLDKDYAKVKDSLYPMLDSGVITFDYLWALWKPSTLVYTTTYGFADDPRVFKVDMASRHSSLFRGNFYSIEGKYLDYDGTRFGYGSVSEEIPEFQGTQKITSLPFYPLSYHKDEPGVRAALVERGKKFVALHGSHYRAYSGIAYNRQRKGTVTKFHIQQSRIMVDPATFRRINPNYCLSNVQPRDSDAYSELGLSESDEYVHEYFSSDNFKGGDGPKVVSRITKDSDCRVLVTKALQKDLEARGKATRPQSATNTKVKITEKASTVDSSGEDKAMDTPEEEASNACLEFSDEDYLVASTVVLGFAFSEKHWLEFAVSRVHEIQWNEDAWGSLVLPTETKDLIRALVMSRKQNAAQTIDDVIQGKGKGLVTVLHGPPGTGKTLTAEGISELLRCPLYMASAGELGTDSRYLETDLQRILDICHAWGAILLLDEADVFLEKRNMQGIHRNALVSVFLRQLEYFQGILFLTTNRVETFDEAFQSRIHIALRYEGLDSKARKTIFQMFIDRVKTLGKLAVEPFAEEDLNKLSKQELNGREIKNMVGSAQDLAISKKESLGMRHIQQVLDIHVKFGRDLRGGGYEDAMRSYC